MREKHVLWLIVAVVVGWFLNRSYPFSTSPFWPWNRAYRNTSDVQQGGSGYGSTDENF